MTYEDSLKRQTEQKINSQYAIDNRAAVSYSISDREETNMFFMDTEDLNFNGFVHGSTIDEENKYEAEENEVKPELTENEQRILFLNYLKEKGLPYDETILNKLVKGEPNTNEQSFLNKIKASYEDGVCPDCGENIPDDVAEGQSCKNCEHVFCEERQSD